MRTVQRGATLGLLGLLGLLAGYDATVGLDVAGWAVGIACGVATSAVLSRGLIRHDLDELGPANTVTLIRAVLACGVAALTADSFGHSAPVATLVATTVVALFLDGLDGWVARRTQTASMLGAQFDMEVDAFLILVLSVYVARSSGAWVLMIGAARYALLVAGWVLPWLRGIVPPRPWCKVVAAVQGVLLASAAAAALPRALTDATLVAALILLAESFGRQVWWLRCSRRPGSLGLVLSPSEGASGTTEAYEVAT